MQIKIVLFASLREALGRSEISLEDLPDSCTAGEVLDRLGKEFPPLEKREFMLARNQAYCTETTHLADGDEVALLPPVGGG